MSIKIIEMFIPKSNMYTRSGRKMTPKSITIHETDNENIRANARAHALLQVNGNRRQASWHFTVDDEQEIYISIPLNEESYHAGTKKGNRESISIEMCVNRDGNYEKTVKHTIKLVKHLMKRYPSITVVQVVQHHYWSGKNCPRKLRSGTKGIDWDWFLKNVKARSNEVTKPIPPSTYETTNDSFTKGQQVRLKKSASHYATGEKIPNRYLGKTFTIQQKGSNRMLLKELYSWVFTKDLDTVTTSHVADSSKITVGDKVKIKQQASKYATGETIPSRYKNKVYTVQQVKSDRVLIKELYSWVKKTDVV